MDAIVAFGDLQYSGCPKVCWARRSRPGRQYPENMTKLCFTSNKKEVLKRRGELGCVVGGTFPSTVDRNQTKRFPEKKKPKRDQTKGVSGTQTSLRKLRTGGGGMEFAFK